eukprot:Phypoly_transcript_19305.p1 GENE.Phypoly_transcript_19305~~Phypoly_transcript_19305.p1  ORF type:complete len:223 (-),score=49.96 Phypoly_transcript_19305:13-681(-)
MKLLTFVCLLLVLATCILARKSNGIIEVDGETYDKVVDGNKFVIVEFVENSWKDSPDFSKVGEEFADRTDVLVLKVDTSESPVLKEKFKLSTLPTLKFYHKGSNTPDDYTGGLSAAEIIDYAHTNINPTLKDLKKHAAEFLSHADQAGVIVKAEELVKDLTSKSSEFAGYVVAYMKRIKEKGVDYVEQERTRLNNLISSKSTVEKKQKEFKKRLSALDLFRQ